jgi:hypothetical protein
MPPVELVGPFGPFGPFGPPKAGLDASAPGAPFDLPDPRRGRASAGPLELGQPFAPGQSLPAPGVGGRLADPE